MALGNTQNVLAGIPDASGGFWAGELIADPAQYPSVGADLSASGLVSVGFINEDGVTEASERDTEKIKAWGGDTIRVLQNEHTMTYTLTFAEMANPEVLKLVYGDENVTVDGKNIEVKHNSKTLPHRSFCIEVLDGETKIRKFIPDGQITETGELQLVHSGIMSIEVTIEAFPDKDGVKVYTTQSKVAGSAEAEPVAPVEGSGA